MVIQYLIPLIIAYEYDIVALNEKETQDWIVLEQLHLIVESVNELSSGSQIRKCIKSILSITTKKEQLPAHSRDPKLHPLYEYKHAKATVSTISYIIRMI